MGIHSFVIDKITNSIEDVITGKSIVTDVLPLEPGDFKQVLKKNGWNFIWKSELKCEDRHVYKLVILKESVIQGLISLQRMPNFMEMHLIEAAPHNYGYKKKYKGVAGNLVAFACKTSFDLGFEGFVSFKAKTDLIQHYIDTLGAQLLYKDRMTIDTINAKNLVNSYYKHYFNDR